MVQGLQRGNRRGEAVQVGESRLPFSFELPGSPWGAARPHPLRETDSRWVGVVRTTPSVKASPCAAGNIFGYHSELQVCGGHLGRRARFPSLNVIHLTGNTHEKGRRGLQEMLAHGAPLKSAHCLRACRPTAGQVPPGHRPHRDGRFLGSPYPRGCRFQSPPQTDPAKLSAP